MFEAVTEDCDTGKILCGGDSEGDLLRLEHIWLEDSVMSDSSIGVVRSAWGADIMCLVVDGGGVVVVEFLLFLSEMRHESR